MSETRTEIGTVNDAARKYGTDAAAIWVWICSERPRTLSDGSVVRLVADRKQENGTTWIVEEVRG